MGRSLLLVLLVCALMLAGLATVNGGVLALALPIMSYLLLGLWRGPDDVSLEIERSISTERTSPGMPVVIQVQVTNQGSELEELFVEDIIPPGLEVIDGSASHVLELKKGGAASWTYAVKGPRGYYVFASMRVTGCDHLGVMIRKRTIPTGGYLLILPVVMRLKHVAIRPRRTRVYAGTIPARQGGPGVEFFGVREYQSGDQTQWINWRASARHPQALFSNEFEQERVADVGIVLDGRQHTNLFNDGRSLFEYSILAAAALADSFLTQGNRVSLLLYGHYLDWTLPGYGRIQRERILHALSRATPGDSLVFSNLAYIPTRLFPAHSQVVLISPLSPDDLSVLIQLRSRGYQVMVISPDPVAFERSYLPQQPAVLQASRIVHLEREIFIKNLQRAGIQVLDWDVRQPFDKVVQSELRQIPGWLRAVVR